MVNLREQGALDYLERLRVCVPNEPISNLPLLGKLLDIEIAYIDRAMNMGNNELSVISIDATGFPELESLLRDVRSTFALSDSIRQSRIEDLKPLIRAFGNASAAGIIEQGKKSAPRIGQDYNIIKALEGISSAERELLSKDSFGLFYRDNNHLGLLLAKDPRHASSNTVGFATEKGYYMVNIPGVAGLKYFDLLPQHSKPGDEINRTQFVLYTLLPDDILRGLRVLTPNRPFFSSYAFDEVKKCRQHSQWDCRGCFQYYGSNGFYEGVAIDFSKAEPLDRVKDEHYKTVVNFGENMQGLHPSLLRLYLSFGTAGLSEQELEAYLKSLHKFGQVIKNTNAFVENSTRMKALTGEEFLAQDESIASELILAMQGLPNEDMEGAFRLVLGEVARDMDLETERVKMQQEALQTQELAWPEGDRYDRFGTIKFEIPKVLPQPRKKFLGLF